MRRIAMMTATAGLLLALPATAGAETVFVGATVLTDWSAAGQVDTITVSDGGASHPGRILVRDASTPTGTPGYGCVDAGAAGVSCSASIISSTSVRTDDLDDSVTVDVAKASWLDAGDGNDTLRGSSVADTVIGGAGNDVLDGRAGADNVYGGDGDDRIDARDGVKDDVDCGAGDDRATVDPIDVVVGCETDPVTGVAPVGGQPPGGGDDDVDAPALPGDDEPTTPLLGDAAMSLISQIAKVAADGLASVGLSCAATEVAGCQGVVYLDPAGLAKGHGKGKGKAKGKAKGHAKKVRALMARRGRYGKSPFVVAAGKSRNLQVRLTPLARKALGLSSSARKARASRRGRRVKAVVTVVQRGHAAKRSVVELRG